MFWFITNEDFKVYNIRFIDTKKTLFFNMAWIHSLLLKWHVFDFVYYTVIIVVIQIIGNNLLSRQEVTTISFDPLWMEYVGGHVEHLPPCKA